jgi:heterodisulfide reductase subunit A-like polyferredoxin
MQNVKAFGQAIVIGAGVGGLLAGRVLADQFDRVTLVERDLFTSGVSNDNDPTFRKGVP